MIHAATLTGESIAGDTVSLADVLNELSDEKALAVIAELVKRKRASVSELASATGMPAERVRRILRILESVGIARFVNGRYELVEESMETIRVTA